MESKMKIKVKIAVSLCCLLAILLVVSCAKGFDDNERFSGGVSNAQLESPEDISFTTLTNPDGSESLKLTWPVVMGAGGYKVNVYNMNDAQNPLAVVKDSIVDGCSMTFTKMEDTNYRVSVLTVGNEKLNNADAKTASEKEYKAFIAVATIHQGEDIAAYINSNMQDFSQDQEQCFILEPGATYTLNDLVDFKLNTVTFRGDKDNRPIIKIGANGGIITQGGLKVKNINFDCSEMETQIGVISLSPTQDPSLNVVALGYQGNDLDKNFYAIDKTIMFQGCNFKNIKNSLIYGNKLKWGVKDFRVMDCILQFNNKGSNPLINFTDNGALKDLTIKNSTFYNLSASASGVFIKLANTQPKKVWGDSDQTSSMTVTNNTFCRTMAKQKFGDRLPNAKTVTLDFSYNIFYDVYQLYQAIVTSASRTTIGNTIFGVTKDTNSNDIGGRTDSNGRPIAELEDPNFDGPTDIEFDFSKPNGGVNFKANGSKAQEYKNGDPRWLE